MDSDEFDEFDDDIADEDLIFAESQAPNNIRSFNYSITKPTPRPSRPQSRRGFDNRPTVSNRNEAFLMPMLIPCSLEGVGEA